MQPLRTLKSFLAVLVLLILPGSLIVAYLRNYSLGAGGHGHGEVGKEMGEGTGAALGKGDNGHAGETPRKRPKLDDQKHEGHE